MIIKTLLQLIYVVALHLHKSNSKGYNLVAFVRSKSLFCRTKLHANTVLTARIAVHVVFYI